VSGRPEKTERHASGKVLPCTTEEFSSNEQNKLSTFDLHNHSRASWKSRDEVGGYLLSSTPGRKITRKMYGCDTLRLPQFQRSKHNLGMRSKDLKERLGEVHQFIHIT
jgi:hypothetical protein